MAYEKKRESKDGIEEKVLLIRRVSKKTTGGNQINFSALVVVGDRAGKVGVGSVSYTHLTKIIICKKSFRRSKKISKSRISSKCQK